MNGSGRYVGISKVASEVDPKAIFEYWSIDNVWMGLIQVEWLIVKDLPNKYLRDVKLR